MKIQLSAVIITFNEERNIARCLDSLQDVADEIIVVDSFSTDKTKDICLSKNVRFIEHAFKGHIEQKNWAVKHAKHPHILSLDADEALSDTLKKSVRQACSNWNADGYTLNRKTNYCGQWINHCGWYPDKKLRLFDSRKGYWGGLNPHDQFFLSENSTIKRLNGDILHYSFYTIEEHIKQSEKFADISAQSLFDRGIHCNSLKVAVRPIARFVRDYILKLGILDGKNGLTICRIQSKAVRRKYKKLQGLC